MTLEMAKTIEVGDELELRYTGELTKVVNKTESINRQYIMFELMDDYNNFNLLSHKELNLHKKWFELRKSYV